MKKEITAAKLFFFFLPRGEKHHTRAGDSINKTQNFSDIVAVITVREEEEEEEAQLGTH